MFNRIVQSFDTGAAVHVFVGRKASRYIGEFLGKFGPDYINACIVQGIMITDCLPQEYREGLKQKCHPYRDVLVGFPDEEVYSWIPEQHRSFIESKEKGKEWAMVQVQQIRTYLMS